jgi:hypothetical protein
MDLEIVCQDRLGTKRKERRVLSRACLDKMITFLSWQNDFAKSLFSKPRTCPWLEAHGWHGVRHKDATLWMRCVSKQKTENRKRIK